MLDNFFNLLDNTEVKKELILAPINFIHKMRKIISEKKYSKISLYNLINKNLDYLILQMNEIDINSEIDNYELFDIDEYNSYINLIVKLYENTSEYEICNIFFQKKFKFIG